MSNDVDIFDASEKVLGNTFADMNIGWIFKGKGCIHPLVKISDTDARDIVSQVEATFPPNYPVTFICDSCGNTIATIEKQIN